MLLHVLLELIPGEALEALAAVVHILQQGTEQQKKWGNQDGGIHENVTPIVQERPTCWWALLMPALAVGMWSSSRRATGVLA